MIQFVDYKDVIDHPGLLIMEDDNEFWHHVRYDTPEETWEELIGNLNVDGFNVSYVRKGYGEIVGPRGSTGLTFQGFLFENGKQKLLFMMKFAT